MRRSMHQFFKAQLRDKFRALGTPRAKKYLVEKLIRADHLPTVAPGRKIEVFRLLAMQIYDPSVGEDRQLLSASETSMLPEAHLERISELIIFSIHCRPTDRFFTFIIAWENRAVNAKPIPPAAQTARRAVCISTKKNFRKPFAGAINRSP